MGGLSNVLITMSINTMAPCISILWSFLDSYIPLHCETIYLSIGAMKPLNKLERSWAVCINTVKYTLNIASIAENIFNGISVVWHDSLSLSLPNIAPALKGLVCA